MNPINTKIISLLLTLGLVSLCSGQVPSKIVANGVELHYIEKGEGEPLILLHGGVGDYRSWDAQFEEFAKKYRVISYSRRFSFPNKNPSVAQYRSGLSDAKDLRALILALGLKKVHLVGLSYGGFTALLFAVDHPEMVRSLVLVEAPAHQLVRRLPGGEVVYKDFFAELKPVADAYRKGDDRSAMVRFNQVMGRDFDKVPVKAANEMLENSLALKAISLAPDPYPDIPRKKLLGLQVPTLIVSGERSSMKIHRLVDAELARLIPGAKTRVIPNAGHAVPKENPAEFNKTVLEFLDSASAAALTNRKSKQKNH